MDQLKSDEELWRETVLALRAKLVRYRNLTLVAQLIGIHRQTLRKALKYERPSELCVIKIEEWIRK